MTGEKTVKCPICGEPYVTVPFYTGDQSACPKCRAKAKGLPKWEKSFGKAC